MTDAERQSAPWWRRILSHSHFPWWAGLLGALILFPALGAGFQMDDQFHRFALLGHSGPWIDLFIPIPSDPVVHREMLANGTLPWWTAAEFQHANFRYLSVLSMKLDYMLWPSWPSLMHLHSLVWMALMVIAVGALYRSVIGQMWVAGLATLLFALDDAHALPTLYLANRNALIATFFGALAILSLTRDRGASPFLCALYLALALSAGEIALGTVGYLAAFGLFLDDGRASRRLSRLAPSIVVLGLWVALYKLGGFGSRGSGFYLDPSGEPLRFLGSLGERVGVLLVGQWTPMPADFYLAAGGGFVGAFQVLGPLVVLGLALGFGRLLFRSSTARFWGAGMMASLIPIAAAGPQNRLLFFVGIGAMGLLAEAIGSLHEGLQKEERPNWKAAPSLAFAALLLFFHVALAPPASWMFLNLQASSGEKIQRAVDSIPDAPELARQDLILVNPVDAIYLGSSIPVMKVLSGKAPPARIRALSAGAPLAITRVDERTLEMVHEGGMFPTDFARFYRSESLPMAVGDGLKLPDFEAVVLAEQNGTPTQVRIRFAKELEHPSLRWVQWSEGVYEPWVPPQIGGTTRLEPSPGVFD